MTGKRRSGRRAQWAPDGQEPPAVDPRLMTREDLFGTYGGGFFSLAQERETWNRAQMADALVAEQLVETPEELDEYRKAVKRDLKAATARLADWKHAGVSIDPKLSDAIENGRMDSAVAALDELDDDDVAEARKRFEDG